MVWCSLLEIEGDVIEFNAGGEIDVRLVSMKGYLVVRNASGYVA